MAFRWGLTEMKIMRVFNPAAACVTAIAMAFTGFFGISAMLSLLSSFAWMTLLFASMLLGIAATQLWLFLFSLFGVYRFDFTDNRLVIRICLGLWSREQSWSRDNIVDIIVANNGTGGPAIGIVAQPCFKCGTLLGFRRISEVVEWLRATVKLPSGSEAVQGSAD